MVTRARAARSDLWCMDWNTAGGRERQEEEVAVLVGVREGAAPNQVSGSRRGEWCVLRNM